MAVFFLFNIFVDTLDCQELLIVCQIKIPRENTESGNTAPMNIMTEAAGL